MSEELPSKKQFEVLEYIAKSTDESGFAPSYREIMTALGLKSVSTVATHVNGLIARGYLIKRDNSARSLQVIRREDEKTVPAPEVNNTAHIKWLQQEVAKRESDESLSEEAEILKAALQLLDQTDEKQV